MAETLNHFNCPDMHDSADQAASNLDLLGNSVTKTGDSYSLSSGSSTNSDSSDEVENSTPSEECKILQTSGSEPEANKYKDTLTRKLRSLSDGQAQEYKDEDDFQVFPSLPDAVLQKLGLIGENMGTRLGEQDMEEKFVALALAFSIDAATLTDRWERQKRYRDQTEQNFSNEIEKLIDKIHKIQPLCVNAERAELFTTLLAQTDVVVKASAYATIASERFGAVQHEHRLAQSAHLMINYVSLLKQQRDSARKQLQYTKRVLQDTNSPESLNNKQRLSPTQLNGNKIITRRRASIATITQPQESKSGSASSPEVRRFTRRTSDLSSRATTLLRSRPSRLELGVDLTYIKEGIAESGLATRQNSQDNQNPPENGTENDRTEKLNSSATDDLQDEDTSSFTKKEKVVYSIRKLSRKLKNKYIAWAATGTLHEFFSVGAIACFSLSLITLGNLMIELEYSQNYT